MKERLEGGEVPSRIYRVGWRHAGWRRSRIGDSLRTRLNKSQNLQLATEATQKMHLAENCNKNGGKTSHQPGKREEK